MNGADLHIHTTFSDGLYSPKAVVDMALKKRLDYMAITDHDHIQGAVEGFDYAQDKPITFLFGVEYSCFYKDEYEKEEVHILGYFPKESISEIKRQVQQFRENRIGRAYKICDKFRELNIDIDCEKLLSTTHSPGRPHFARELIRLGYVDNINEGFSKYLTYGKPCFVPKSPYFAAACIEDIRSLGGISIVAHPGILKRKVIVDRLIRQGLDGIEVYHPKHRQQDKIELYQRAKDEGLLISGGSDFHDLNKVDHYIGATSIRNDYAERIVEAIDKRKKII
ncbi:MAG TPA: phosphatase [Eubacteriaceae bacterium]|nr:phosphatase [Eubacteriaceae bacterium]